MNDSEVTLSAREEVALEFTDQVMAYHGIVTDALMRRVQEQFSTEEIVALQFQVGLMNAANWFVIANELERE